MSKVLIDRELLERVKTLCEEWFVRGQQPHMSATDYKVWHAIGFASKAFDSLRTALAAPSGTPAMPVKAYYHEAPNEYGGLNKSVGLEVRKEFADAPLVLEADALARIACLEGEIAKRDEELAACRVAVENCELFRARIAELEALSVTKVMLDIVPGDGDGYEVYAKSVSDVETKLGELGEENEELQFEREQLRAELAAIKAQGVVMLSRDAIREVFMRNGFTVNEGQADLKPYVYAAAEELLRLNAAPVVSGRNTMDSGVCVTDCRSSDGVAVGIIDAVITLARVFNGREVTPAVEEALIDLRSDEDVISMISFTQVVSGQGVPDGWRDGYRAAMNSAASGARQLYVQHCHHHGVNGLLDRCKELEQSFIRDADALLTASPAAPAADAGIVDMYRHLQKVTPYRFKKIQDASITDGGDVMYFHKDRFDAALLADMAAHRAKGVV